MAKSSKERRPIKLTEPLKERILAKIAGGLSVRKLCEDKRFPTRQTFYKWLKENEEFRKLYEEATELRAESIFEEILDIADDSSNDYLTDEDTGRLEMNKAKLARDKMRIDARKWALAKMIPTKYGNNVKAEVDAQHSGEIRVVLDDFEDL